jgi:hypothetical protein
VLGLVSGPYLSTGVDIAFKSSVKQKHSNHRYASHCFLSNIQLPSRQHVASRAVAHTIWSLIHRCSTMFKDAIDLHDNHLHLILLSLDILMEFNIQLVVQSASRFVLERFGQCFPKVYFDQDSVHHLI